MFKRENLKKKSLLRKVTALGLTLTLLPGVLTGCSSKSEASEVKKIVIGSGNSYNPYCYIDESGNAVGYEYDVLAAIDELLPQYEFEYKSMAFDQILLSLDSGKIDVAAHQYEYTDERASKYLFSDESYTSYITYISVLSDDNEINGLEHLA